MKIKFFVLVLLAVVLTTNKISAFVHDTLVAGQKGYYLVFAARAPRLIPFSIGGHAFVTWGIQSAGDTISAVQTLGFFPEEGSNLVKAIAKCRPGHIKRGFFKNSNKQFIRQMIVKLDFDTWKMSLDSTLRWDGHQYNLFKFNCLTFLDNIADNVKMDTPSIRYLGFYPKTPYKYLRQLRRNNKQKNIKKMKVFDHGDGITTDKFVSQSEKPF